METSAQKLPLCKAHGTFFEIGVQIGTHFKDLIQSAFRESSLIHQRLTWDKKNPTRVNTAVKLTDLQYPQYLQEMRGIAKGAELPVRNILVVNFMHLPAIPDCSTLMYHTSTTATIVHNEDHEWGLAHYSYLISVEYPNGLRMIAHCYPGVIPGLSFAFTSHGLAMTCNYVPEPDPKIGIPRTIIGRELLEAQSLAEVRERITTISPRSGGVNFNVASIHSPQILNIELTGREYAITPVNAPLFHANHYSSEKFAHLPVPDDFAIHSVARLQQGQKLLENFEISPAARNEALQVMWDPIIHFDLDTLPSGEKFLTLCTLIFEVTDQIHLDIYVKSHSTQPIQQFSSADLQ